MLSWGLIETLDCRMEYDFARGIFRRFLVANSACDSQPSDAPGGQYYGCGESGGLVPREYLSGSSSEKHAHVSARFFRRPLRTIQRFHLPIKKPTDVGFSHCDAP